MHRVKAKPIAIYNNGLGRKGVNANASRANLRLTKNSNRVKGLANNRPVKQHRDYSYMKPQYPALI